MIRYYSAREAAQRLGVSRQTLYSYVSRGRLRAHADGASRESRYLADEVNQLAVRLAQGHNPRAVVAEALNWGLPVVESSICLIQNGHLYYRGEDVLSLVETRSFEEVATLLWGRGEGRSRDLLPKNFAALAARCKRLPTELAMSHLFAWVTESENCADLLFAMAACFGGSPLVRGPVPRAIGRRWRLSALKSDALRVALILCADHELNASSFTVRTVASTGASLNAALGAGLAALSGERHGGSTNKVETLLDDWGASRKSRAAVQSRLGEGAIMPGFGHPLYPDGDIRAAALLERISDKKCVDLARAVERDRGLKPNLDFALVALRRALGLPRGAAFGVFAVGRTVGWLAHALEQRELKQLLRPRAAYTGPQPPTA